MELFEEVCYKSPWVLQPVPSHLQACVLGLGCFAFLSCLPHFPPACSPPEASASLQASLLQLSASQDRDSVCFRCSSISMSCGPFCVFKCGFSAPMLQFSGPSRICFITVCVHFFPVSSLCVLHLWSTLTWLCSVVDDLWYCRCVGPPACPKGASLRSHHEINLPWCSTAPPLRCTIPAKMITDVSLKLIPKQ